MLLSFCQPHAPAHTPCSSTSCVLVMNSPGISVVSGKSGHSAGNQGCSSRNEELFSISPPQIQLKPPQAPGTAGWSCGKPPWSRGNGWKRPIPEVWSDLGQWKVQNWVGFKISFHPQAFHDSVILRDPPAAIPRPIPNLELLEVSVPLPPSLLFCSPDLPQFRLFFLPSPSRFWPWNVAFVKKKKNPCFCFVLFFYKTNLKLLVLAVPHP